MSAKASMRMEAPENIGRPASCCATPMVNGLQMPEAKPQLTASRLMPIPVSTSQPRLVDSATTMGTSGTHSSKEPIIAPMPMKNRMMSAMSL